MSERLSKLVLFSFLALALPWPCYEQIWGFLPAGRVLMLAAQLSNVAALSLLAQGLIMLGLNYLLCGIYIRISAQWPLKIRGAVVGIIALSLIVSFSSFPVYKSVSTHTQSSVEFRELYHW